MRASVYTDRALERYAGRFVWLSVDTEDARNSAFLTRYPVSVWPTLLVIEPRRETIALRYAGGATVSQLETLLVDGESATGGAPDAAGEAIRRADRLANEGSAAEASKAYEAAIAAAPPQWPSRGRAAEGLTASLQGAADHERCARRALELLPSLRGTYSGANVASTGVACASRLSDAAPGRTALLQALEGAVRESLEDE